MSNIRVGEISAENGTDPVILTKQSASKAWVTFKGTSTAVIEASEGVASIVDNGTGDYTVNFSNSFSSANYGYAGMGGLNTTSLVCVTQPRTLIDPTASSIRHQTVRVDATVIDARVVSIAYHGDLA